MLKTARIVASMAAVVCSSTLAADMLPLKQGIYVPANRPCKRPPMPNSKDKDSNFNRTKR